MYDGSVRISTEIDTKSFDAQITQLQKKLEMLEKSADETNIPKQFRRSAEETRNLNAEIEKTRNQIISLTNQQNKLNQTANKVDFSKWTKSLRRTALALFGVQSVMSVISKASRTYLSQNEQAQQKINALWTALGNLIGPIIEMIANGILKLVGYLNVFVKALSGGKIDLTKNMNANAKATNKAAQAQEKYNKQLAGFDEMNIISDTGSTQDDNITSFEMPELDDRIVKKLQDLAKWLKENWDWIWKVGVALGAVFGIAKISGLLKNIGKLLGFATGNGSGLLGLSSILKTLATIGVIAIGVDLTYKALTGRDLVKDLKDIKDGLTDLHKKNGDIQKDNKKLHKDYMQILNDKDKEAKSYQKGSQELAQYIGQLESNVDMAQATIQSNKEWEASLNPLEKGLATLDGSMKTHKETTKQSKEEIERMKESYKKLYDQGQLNEEQTKKYIDFMARLGYNVDGTKMSYEQYTNYLDTKVKNGQKITADEMDTLIQKMGGLKEVVDDTTKKNYLLKIKSNIEGPSDSNVQEIIEKLKKKFNAAKLVLSSGGGGTGSFGGGASGGGGFRAKGGIYHPSIMPKLAVGGIINNPGRGVPYHGATIAERGAEAVVPLTDSQQMSLLGETIGRYITVNLTNVTELDGRQIARKVDKIQQNNNFVFNR